MVVKFDLIAAACENMGIGINGNLPWRLKSEMAYFSQMTSQTKEENKKNIVLMGRTTWESIPKKFKPLANRINFVLSRSNLDVSNYTNVYAFKSLDDVVKKLQDENFNNLYENVWVIGGSYIYDVCMKSKHFHRLYLTKIMQNFECDTYFPKLRDNLNEIKDSRVPEGIQEENGIKFTYKVYENLDFSK